MPLTKREEARESGFAQVREAMQSFAGDIVSAEWGMWGGQLIDEDTGKPIPPKEFLEVVCNNLEILETTEELAFVPDEWNFRVNCSDYKGSFWVEDFLASADGAKLLIPDDLMGKRIVWKKVTRSWDIKGKPVSYTNFVIDKVLGVAGVQPTPQVVDAPQAGTAQPAEDPMLIACDLAVGKTETQFRSAISLHPKFVGSPLLSLAKAGAITKALMDEGKLVEVQEGNKTVYAKP